MSNSTPGREALRATLQGAFDFAQSQAQSLLRKYPPDYYPMYTVGGKFGHDRKRWTHWCDGFYPGLMFIFAEATGDGAWLDKAVAYATPLEERQYDRAVHDLGFLFFSTHLRWLGLGGPKERIEPLLVQAGKTMAMRFMERGQYLRSFVEPASLFIDIMMNVGVIFYAGLKTGDERLLDVAHSDLRPRDRPVPSPDDASRLSRRLLLEPRPCLVAIRLHAFIFADRADGVSGDGYAQRRLLPGEYGAGRRDAVGL